LRLRGRARPHVCALWAPWHARHAGAATSSSSLLILLISLRRAAGGGWVVGGGNCKGNLLCSDHWITGETLGIGY
jgi:hypothetical protein